MPTSTSPPSSTMRVSAIRFAPDLWQVLETEAARVGVSVSQYVREAALMRVAAAATARGEDPFQLLAATSPNTAPTLAARPGAADPAPLHHASAEVAATRALRAPSQHWIERAQAAAYAAQAALDAALAVTAQTKQARHQTHKRKTKPGGQERT